MIDDAREAASRASLFQGRMSEGQTMHHQGFTLLELMIVIAVIALLAAIAIPNLLESRLVANEQHAATNLKSAIFPGQISYRTRNFSDLDQDNSGEFAHLGHLAGTRKCWGTNGLNGLGPGVPNYMPVSFDSPDVAADASSPTEANGGYLYASYLHCGSIAATSDQINAAERYFCIATVPEIFDDTGRHAFCITQEGHVLTTSALTDAWSGNPDAAVILCFSSVVSAVTQDNRTALWK